jgi:hypothetical protein
MKMINTSEILHDLLSKPFTPFTVMQLRQEISDVLLLKIEEPPQKVVCEFLYSKLKELVDSINIPLLNQISSAIKIKAMERKDLQNLKLSPNPTIEEATTFCNTIHNSLQQTQVYKEELIHYISFFTQAKGYVNSFASSSEIVLKDYFEGRKELKYQKDALLNDLEVYKVYLTSLVKELNNILEEVLSPRTNLELRMESSLRLLERYRDPSVRGFTIQS